MQLLISAVLQYQRAKADGSKLGKSRVLSFLRLHNGSTITPRLEQIELSLAPNLNNCGTSSSYLTISFASLIAE